MPYGDGRKVRDAMWTREKHAHARALTTVGNLAELASSTSTRELADRLAMALDERDMTLGKALDEIERLSKEIAYLWTAGGITPNPALELPYAVWMAKEEVGV